MSNEQRRENERRILHAPAAPLLRWKGHSGEHDASISDISIGGCFLNTTGEAMVGEVITLKTSLPTGELVELQGKVVHHQSRLAGFGLSFNNPSEEQSVLLELLIAEADEGSR